MIQKSHISRDIWLNNIFNTSINIKTENGKGIKKEIFEILDKLALSFDYRPSVKVVVDGKDYFFDNWDIKYSKDEFCDILTISSGMNFVKFYCLFFDNEGIALRIDSKNLSIKTIDLFNL